MKTAITTFLALGLGASLAAASSPPAGGGGGNHGHKRTFETFLERFDADHDGKVSLDEAAKPRVFRMADKDGDGVVTKAEVDALERPRAKEMAAKWLEKADANHDGRVTMDEAKALRKGKLDKLDANHDGFIDRSEYDAAKARAHEKKAAGDAAGQADDDGIDAL